MNIGDGLASDDCIELFGIRFPLMTKEEAAAGILKNLSSNKKSLVCFADMSFINIIEKDPQLKKVIQEQFVTLNDGIGLQIASILEKHPFPENLNGTDFTPFLLSKLPGSTSVFLIGSQGEVSEKTAEIWKKKYPRLNFLGSHSGFFNDHQEKQLIDKVKALKPDIILVGMGNPQQIQFIEKNSGYKELSNVQWLAVGGLFDFYGGKRRRAPDWMIKCKLEWLHIIWLQPHKFLRYVAGIPLFIVKTLKQKYLKIIKS